MINHILLDLRRSVAAIISFVLISGAMPAAAVTCVPTAQPTGVWINRAHSVEIVTAACGAALCGRITWANSTALNDARAGGVLQLTGTEILEDYHRADPASWQGRVLIPDMGRTFYSTLTLVDSDRLKISGCILGGLLCKSQVWTHVPTGTQQP